MDCGHWTSTMSRFRYVTPHHTGKWYATLEMAQRFASRIGAGFLDPRSGRFVAYPDTTLECSKA